MPLPYQHKRQLRISKNGTAGSYGNCSGVENQLAECLLDLGSCEEQIAALQSTIDELNQSYQDCLDALAYATTCEEEDEGIDFYTQGHTTLNFSGIYSWVLDDYCEGDTLYEEEANGFDGI